MPFYTRQVSLPEEVRAVIAFLARSEPTIGGVVIVADFSFRLDRNTLQCGIHPDR